jgi:TnpA family transposase
MNSMTVAVDLATEHYTDTADFTDHMFALCHRLGFRFAPKIRDLADKRIYVPRPPMAWPALSPLIGGSPNLKLIEQQFDEVIRLAASIKQGTVTASLILRKLAAYPRQKQSDAGASRARAYRAHTIHAGMATGSGAAPVNTGLNKGEARNALVRAVFFNRLGEIRDRSFEYQRYRASGLNLIVAAITLWNTVWRNIEDRQRQSPIFAPILPWGQRGAHSSRSPDPAGLLGGHGLAFGALRRHAELIEVPNCAIHAHMSH